jgi:acetate kinase
MVVGMCQYRYVAEDGFRGQQSFFFVQDGAHVFVGTALSFHEDVTFSYRVLKYIGAYAAAMNGADLIVFTGGIGENDAHVRELIGTRLGYLGVTFDKEKNKTVRGEDTILSTNSSGTKIAVISTDEELVIATDTLNLTN